MTQRIPTGLWAISELPKLVAWPEPNGADDPTTRKKTTKRAAIRGAMAEDSWWGCSYGSIRDALAQAVSEGARTFVLDIDSPGGTVAGVRETVAAIEAAREKMNVIAYVSGSCQSAALWVASACDRIYAADTSVIGSVGSLLSVMDASAAMEDAGVVRYVWRSERTPDKAPAPDSKAFGLDAQGLVNAAGDAFLGDLARLRNVKGGLDAVAEAYMRGRSLPAAEALAAGWVDEIVGTDAAHRWLTIGAGEIPLKFTLPPASRPAAAASFPVARQTKGSGMADTVKSLAALAALGIIAQDAGDGRLVLSADEGARVAQTLTSAREEATAAKVALQSAADTATGLQAQLATLKAAEDKRSAADLVARHVKRGAIPPAKASEWEGKAAALGIDALAGILDLLPASAPMAPIADGSPVTPPDPAGREVAIANRVRVLMAQGHSAAAAFATAQKEVV